MLTQTMWRTVGVVALGCCVVMALLGVNWQWLRQSLTVFAAYWGVFLFLLVVALFCALLDIRHVRMEYSVGKRELFRQTLGDEGLRKTLRDAQRKASRKDKTPFN